MQTTCKHHDQIRKIVFLVSQHILYGSRTLDTCDGMFNPDTNFGNLAIALFLSGSQFSLVRLFFG